MEREKTIAMEVCGQSPWGSGRMEVMEAHDWTLRGRKMFDAVKMCDHAPQMPHRGRALEERRPVAKSLLFMSCAQMRHR